MDFTTFISENLLILVPAIYVVGIFVKRTERISDKYIPLILLFLSIALTVATNGVHATSVIQGILISGAAVLSNELLKQAKKEE